MPYPIREVLPDRFYFVTNRCLGSRFLIRPSEDVNRIFAAWLIRACRVYGVELYAAVVISSHFHLIVRCPRANLDAFMRYFEANLAHSLNKHWQRDDSTVFPRRYSSEPILDDGAFLERILYILLNPVKANLVDTVEDWPGFSTAPELLRNQRRVFVVFDRTAWHRAGCPGDRSPFQQSLPLQIAVPPMWHHLSPKERARRLRNLVADHEQQLRDERRATGRSILGVRAVLHTNPTDRPRRINKSPRPLCHASSRERWDEYRFERARFLDAYKIASALWRSGDRSAKFPRGSFPPWIRQAA